MSVVAPITAVGAACLPVAVGLLRGERPGVLALAGVAVALVAVVAVSMSAAPGGTAVRTGGAPLGLVEAILAGLAFGAFFVILSGVSEEAGTWPLLAGRTSSVLVVGVAALVTRTPLRPAQSELPRIALAGVLDMGANVLYVLAVQVGLLSLVGVLVSLYPASTVLLARLTLGERMGRLQVAGVALAVTGAALIALG